MSDRPTRRPRGAPLNHAPEAVKYAREKAGLTKRALAAACGFSEQLMCDIEAGRRSATPEKLSRIAVTLNCPLVALESKRSAVPETAPQSEPEERRAPCG